MTPFLQQYGQQIATLTIEHLWLTGAAMLFATVIAVPVGVWLTRAPAWARGAARERRGACEDAKRRPGG